MRHIHIVYLSCLGNLHNVLHYYVFILLLIIVVLKQKSQL